METWATLSPYGDKVQYLCVCVEQPPNGLYVCKLFANMFSFDKAVNAYIPGRSYMPVGYGQLGCSGFIVVDGQAQFISRKSKAFLDYGEEAFRDVERMVQMELQRLNVDEATTTTPSSQSKEEHSTTSQNESKKETIVSIECPSSVGDAAMDEEHQECTTAINYLLQNPTQEALTEVIQVLEEHFRHEEDLLRDNGFGSDTDPLSPLVSHRKDHDRILNIGKEVLDSCGAC